MALKKFYQEGSGFLRQLVLSLPKTIDKTAVDAGNTGNTTLLRQGLTLGKITASGKLVEYDDDGTDDGRRTAVGVLMHDVDLADDGTAADKVADVLWIGHIDATKCIGWDAAAAADLATRIFP